jgi:hypothetical protein
MANRETCASRSPPKLQSREKQTAHGVDVILAVSFRVRG